MEPIQSRCVVFRFKPLSLESISKQLQYIAKVEGLTMDDAAIRAIEYVSNGDLRKSINVLQAASSLSNQVTEQAVYEVASRARPEEVKKMIGHALNGDFLDARKQLDVLLYEHGMSGEDVISQIYRETMDLGEEILPSKVKIRLVDIIGEYDFRLVEGASERIQLEALLAQFAQFKTA